MSQNTSSAVMQQRLDHTDKLNFFPTPPWATRALCEWLRTAGYQLATSDCLEPAAGRGHMARPLAEYFGAVEAADIVDLGMGYRIEDFLFPGDDLQFDWTISNPPFVLADQFIVEGIRRSRVGCAMFVRTSFLEGMERHRALFSVHKPKAVLQFTERVILAKGICRDPAIAYIDEKGEKRKPSSATSYCWIIWARGRAGYPTEFHWIEPSRRKLERPGDYDEVAP